MGERQCLRETAGITARMTKEMQELCPLYTRAKVIDGILWGLGRNSAAEA